MSDADRPAGGIPGGQAPGPSEEELRAALGQLRAAPVDQVVAEVASALLNAAQVKLGRRDARLLIDLTTDVAERTRGQVADELVRQIDQALTQLRLAQVEAEREVAAAAEEGHAEPNDLAGGAAAGGADRPAGQAPPSTPPPSTDDRGGAAASRLWIPGR